MEMKAFLYRLLLQFFYIVAGTFIATTVFCTLIVPSASLSVGSMWRLLLFCLLADLPGLVYYSKGELGKRRRLTRTVLHTALLLAVLMVAGKSFDMYRGLYDGIFFAFIILCVDVFVRLMTFAKDMRMAGEINQRLKERQTADRH